MRTLSSAIQAEILRPDSHAMHLLTFGPVNGTTYYYGEDVVKSFLSHDYIAGLIFDSAVKYTQTLTLNPTTVKIQNIDLAVAAILAAQQQDVQGVPATLYRWYPRINDYVVLFSGVVTQIDVDEQTVQLALAGDLDPTASQVPTRTYMPTCAWIFTDANCGYVNTPNDPDTGLPFVDCAKDFLSCGARARTQSFSGFIHILPGLTLQYEGQAPDAAQQSGAPTTSIAPWEQM